MRTSCPFLTNSFTPAGVMATRYSWFLTSLGTPTLMIFSPPRCSEPAWHRCQASLGSSGLAPGQFSALRRVSSAQHRESVLPRGIRGEHADHHDAVVQVPGKYSGDHHIERCPLDRQMSLLVIGNVLTLSVRNAGQAARQVNPQPLAGDSWGGEEISKHLPVCGQVASLFKQFALRRCQRRLPRHIAQAGRYLP